MPQTDPELSISKLKEELMSVEGGEIILLHFNPLNYSELTLEALSFLINEKEAGIMYITASRPYCYLSRVMKDRKISKENLLFIDCITYLANVPSELSENCVFVETPAELEDVGMHTARLMGKIKTKNKFLFIDSMSTLLIYNNMRSLREFSTFIKNLLRDNGVGGIFITINGHSGEYTIEMLAGVCNKIIRIE